MYAKNEKRRFLQSTTQISSYEELVLDGKNIYLVKGQSKYLIVFLFVGLLVFSHESSSVQIISSAIMSKFQVVVSSAVSFSYHHIPLVLRCNKMRPVYSNTKAFCQTERTNANW